MTEHKTEHKAEKANGDSKSSKEVKTVEPAAVDSDEMVFESYQNGPDVIEAHQATADENGLLDGAHGTVGYKPGDLIVKDGEPVTSTKQLYYVIPAEAASAWEKTIPVTTKK